MPFKPPCPLCVICACGGEPPLSVYSTEVPYHAMTGIGHLGATKVLISSYLEMLFDKSAGLALT